MYTVEIMGAAFLMLLAGLTAPAPSRAVVTRPVVDMYSKPTTEASVVSQALYGMTVAVERQEGVWLRIHTPGDDYPGWVEAAAVRPAEVGETYAGGRAATVESLFAHLYREASVTRHRPVLTVPFETRLELAAEAPSDGGRWWKVRLVDGSEAFVQAGDVTLEPRPRTVPELIELARRFLGLPYTWGGRSSYGYDCSGFTQMLVRRGGTLMPRDAQPQADWERMKPVERAALEAGDLLYYGASGKKITHTGFYIGNGEFIHATTNSHPVVQISRLADEPWTRILVACRRWKP